MKLPNTIENFERGIFFYLNKRGSYELIKVESRSLILIRRQGSWHSYEDTREFWNNPSDNSIAQSDIERAIQLVDENQSKGREITKEEVKTFEIIF